MSFADELRKRSVKPQVNNKYLSLITTYKNAIHKATNAAANKGQRHTAFYVINNRYYFDACDAVFEVVESLPMYEGTPQQRALAMKQASETRGTKFPEKSRKLTMKLGYEIDSINAAREISALISEELKKMGFTRYNIEIKEFHHVQFSCTYVPLIEVARFSYSELPSTFYYLRLSISW